MKDILKFSLLGCLALVAFLPLASLSARDAVYRGQTGKAHPNYSQPRGGQPHKR